ncbi:MAG: SRPBCC family protein [Arenicellales bacterium]
MKFLKRFILLMLLIVLAAIGIGYELPDTAHVERTVRIKAPPQTVFPYVNNPRKFNEWSPWARKDPDMKTTYSGPESGVGAIFTWHSDNPDIGSGRRLITLSKPPSDVAARLEMSDQGTATTYFKIEAAGDSSRVTWGFDTQFGDNIIQRYFGLMMDRWIGKEYDQGLQNLKTLVEKKNA